MSNRSILQLILALAFCGATAQVNLVPNPSFESYTVCPTTNGNITDCSNWLNFGNTPDYYNACSSTLNVPNTGVGFQFAHTGAGMTGIVMYQDTVNSNNPQYREYMGAQLSSQLIIGQKYYLSFYVNFSKAEEQQAIECNKMGMKLFMTPYNSTQHCPTNNLAHLSTDSIIKDTVNWIRISGSFIADSTYKYIAVGNFFDDAHTDTMAAGAWPWAKDIAYYFIDDICVTTDSLYNENWTAISTINKKSTEIKIYPNPSSDILSIKATEDLSEVQLINDVGQIVYSIPAVNDLSFQFSVSDFPIGLYLIKVKTKKNIYNSVVNIIH